MAPSRAHLYADTRDVVMVAGPQVLEKGTFS